MSTSTGTQTRSADLQLTSLTFDAGGATVDKIQDTLTNVTDEIPTAAAVWAAISAAGGGNVSNVGSPADNQVAVWTGATSLEGTSALTFDGSELYVNGAINLTGNLYFDAGQTVNTITTTVDGSSLDTELPTAAAVYAAITGGGGGNVSNSGTPADNQIAVWVTSTTIEGTSALTFANNVLKIETSSSNPAIHLEEGTDAMEIYYDYSDNSLNIGYDANTAGETANEDLFYLTTQYAKLGLLATGSTGYTINTYIQAFSSATVGSFSVYLNTDIGLSIVSAAGSIIANMGLSTGAYFNANNASNVATIGISGGAVVTVNASGFALQSGSTVNNIQSSITDVNNAIATSSAIISYVAGLGYVDTSGTPANNQLAVFTDADTVEGDSSLTWTGSVLQIGSLTESTDHSLYIYSEDSTSNRAKIVLDSAAPWIELDSSSSNGNYYEQAAGISLGESGVGAAALHIVYTGDGKAIIGMGDLENPASDLRPTYKSIQFMYTNDAVGIAKAANASYQLGVGGNLQIDTVSQIASDTDKFLMLDTTGEVKYVTGDNLLAYTGASEVNISNGANNRVLTDTGLNSTINAEANLTFDGSTLTVTGNAVITSIANLATTATAFLVSDSGEVKYRSKAQLQSDLDIGWPTQEVSSEAELDAAVTTLNTYGFGDIVITGAFAITENKSYNLTGITIRGTKKSVTLGTSSVAYTITITAGSPIFHDLTFYSRPAGNSMASQNTRPMFIMNGATANSLTFHNVGFANVVGDQGSSTYAPIEFTTLNDWSSVSFFGCRTTSETVGTYDNFSIKIPASVSGKHFFIYVYDQGIDSNLEDTCLHYEMLGGTPSGAASFYTDGSATLKVLNGYTVNNYITTKDEQTSPNSGDKLLLSDATTNELKWIAYSDIGGGTGTNYFDRTGTIVTLATAGDTLRMNTTEKLEFYGTSNYIAATDSNSVDITVGGDLDLNISTANLRFGVSDFVPISASAYNLGNISNAFYSVTVDGYLRNYKSDANDNTMLILEQTNANYVLIEHKNSAYEWNAGLYGSGAYALWDKTNDRIPFSVAIGAVGSALLVKTAEVVVNDDSGRCDFRAESDLDQYAFMVDCTNEIVKTNIETRLGGGAGSNYTKFTNDTGHQSMVGTAQAAMDMWKSVDEMYIDTSGGVSSFLWNATPTCRFSDPADNTTEGYLLASFVLPYDRSSYGTGEITWHSMYVIDGAGTGNIKWYCDYIILENDDAWSAFTSMTTSSGTYAVSSTNSNNKLIVTGGGSFTISPSVPPGSLLVLKMYRADSGRDDTYTGDAYVIGLGLRFNANQIGNTYNNF